MPSVGGLDDRFEIGVLGDPVELSAQARGVGDQLIGIARAAWDGLYLHWLTGNLLHHGNDLFIRIARAGTSVIGSSHGLTTHQALGGKSKGRGKV